MTDNSGALIKATSGEPEIEAALLLSSHLREDPKTPGCVNALTEPNPPQPSLLIGLLLLTWLDLSIIILDEPSAETTRDQPRSQALPVLSLHHFLSSLRAKAIQDQVERTMRGKS